MLMRAAGFSSGQKLRHSFQWIRLLFSLCLSLLSFFPFLSLSLCHSFASQDPISPTIISFRKPSIRKGWICTGPRSGLLIDCWLNVVSTAAMISSTRDLRSLYRDTPAISTLDEINSMILLEVGRSILSSINLINYFALWCVCRVNKKSAWFYPFCPKINLKLITFDNDQKTTWHSNSIVDFQVILFCVYIFSIASQISDKVRLN